MVVLAAAVISRSGRVLLSRQYVDMTRIRIEGLLSAFPKLVGAEKQHTYVETENVRYVYQPVETLYVLLVTTKKSNIVEDLETLRLIGKILPEYSPRYGVVDESSVLEAAFDIIFSFDEVIDWGGMRENVNLSQIATFTEMYSHEDRLAKMIMESKMQEAKEEAKRKADAINKSKDPGDGLGIFGKEISKIMHSSGLGGLANDLGFHSKKPANPESIAARGGISSESYRQQADLGVSNMSMNIMNAAIGSGAGVRGSSSMMSGFGSNSSLQVAPVSVAPTKKGMSLSKNKKQDSLLDAMRTEGEMVDAPIVSRKRGGSTLGTGSAPTADFLPVTEAIHLVTSEKLNLTISKDGGVESMEVKGNLTLRINDSSKGMIRVKLHMGDNSEYKPRPHPNIDKTLFSTANTLGLKDPSRPFPTGNPLAVLMWKLETRDEKLIPLQITCWPSESSDGCQVNLEYELIHGNELRDVVITVPVHAGNNPPQLTECSAGEFGYNPRIQSVTWAIPMIDSSNGHGTIEFVAQERNPNAFFPVTCSFSSKHTYAQIAPVAVEDIRTGEPVKFSQEVSLSTEQFSIV
mmetsp:Transcript_1200/g.2521  ORF Transcript_1200/g.2521 Transcript_1200/m.2521 type:complete len:575 (-) Transcript_1200:1144-2868(-)|eukprot:CAMPEP_0184683436 /NCGR_PEP_ID=MMETSP0312-20130426/11351_1 /TAXON_ID=31354 /ORGANISM="Compsopogon coeruleus, Strain SAG 36.94" /LENGTH=574 /DNA_ID=CAMNT_0027135799 /DNA_START=25 /DNA_END=1749 /DNA_ORIENTATION=-